MQIQLTAPTIGLASAPVDFRKSIVGLTEIVKSHYQQHLNDSLYIFYNRSKNRLKCLGCHRQGMLLIYKVLHKQRFHVPVEGEKRVSLDAQKLSWLLAGLDWQRMSGCDDLKFPDYF